MSKPERIIETSDIRTAIANGEIIEDYQGDIRGHSCLVSGCTDKRHIHIICAPKDDYLAIISAYLPSDDEWENGYQKKNNEMHVLPRTNEKGRGTFPY
jgi:hypothetical protein